VNATRLVGF